jgi:hypothetical protein
VPVHLGRGWNAGLRVAQHRLPKHLGHHNHLSGVPVIVHMLVLTLLAGGGSGRPVQRNLPKKTVGCPGDSIFAGACGTSVCSELGLLLPAGYVEVNKAVSGETAHQIATRMISEAPTACLGEPCGTYAGNGAVNTLKEAGNAGLSDAAAAELALYGDGASVLGIMDGWDWIHANYPRATKIATGVLPYGGCDGATCPPPGFVRPGERAAAFNAAFLAACAARPWLRCISPYDAFEDPQNQDRLLPAIACADGIHLNGGHDDLARLLKATRAWR